MVDDKNFHPADTNGDGEISATERARGKELLEELKKNFTFGLDVRVGVVVWAC